MDIRNENDEIFHQVLAHIPNGLVTRLKRKQASVIKRPINQKLSVVVFSRVPDKLAGPVFHLREHTDTAKIIVLLKTRYAIPLCIAVY
jgi:hypothetical protein